MAASVRVSSEIFSADNMIERPKTERFCLGDLLADKAAGSLMQSNPDFASFVQESLERHAGGDWGDLGGEDRKVVDECLANGKDVASFYVLYPNHCVRIVTVADRSYTVISLIPAPRDLTAGGDNAFVGDHPPTKPHPDETLPAIFYFFERDIVETCDFAEFLEQFHLDRWPPGQALAQLEGRLNLFINGYDDDPRQLYEIPEVRRFYYSLFDVWPYWLYFCQFNQNLLLMMICRWAGYRNLNEIVSIRSVLDDDALNRFAHEALPSMNDAFERAELPEASIESRCRDFFEFLKSCVRLW
jgi:hypothetical protein